VVRECRPVTGVSVCAWINPQTGLSGTDRHFVYPLVGDGIDEVVAT
jgi:hypothetical protein